CPLAESCEGRATGDPARLPVKAPKKAKPVRQGRAWWIEREGAVWLVRREGKGMLGGMRALPDDGWSARADGSGEPPQAGTWDSAGVVRHTFTHFQLELSVQVQRDAIQPEGAGEWWPLAELGAAGLPTLFAKAARLVRAG
ncbi:MAG: NUDIX domain-containing protein, partial [Erythrobacter sp.]